MQSRAEQLYPIYKLYPRFLTRIFDNANEKIHNIVRAKINKRKKRLSSNKEGKRYLLDVMIEGQVVRKNLEKDGTEMVSRSTL